MICRHCHNSKSNRPRGLCWVCYYTPGVKDRFGPINKYGRRGIGNFNRKTKLPSFPTNALPGTPQKIAVLEQRAQQGVSLWHPLDAVLDVPVSLGMAG